MNYAADNGDDLGNALVFLGLAPFFILFSSGSSARRSQQLSRWNATAAGLGSSWRRFSFSGRSASVWHCLQRVARWTGCRRLRRLSRSGTWPMGGRVQLPPVRSTERPAKRGYKLRVLAVR